MKTINSYFILLTVATTTVMLSSCDPNSDNPNPQEVITTLRVTATPVSGPALVFEVNDPDGDGGNPPSIDTIRLAASSQYHVALDLFNEAVTPVDTITNEIMEEGTDHQFFFTMTGVNITSTYNDTDTNGNPIGLHDIWVTGASSSGTLQIRLKHQPGIKDGNINTGETDIQVDFPTIVQ